MDFFKKINWGWKLTLPGGILAIIGVVFLFLWGESRDNMLLALVTIGGIAGGIYLFKKGIDEAYPPGSMQDRRKKAAGPPPNSYNIYPDRADFEYVKKPLGMPQTYLNDGQLYYVHEYDPVTRKLKEWQLPDINEDDRHYDPRELANVVTMPCSKKYLEWVPNTFQMVAFGVMGVIIGAEIIGLIIFWGN